MIPIKSPAEQEAMRAAGRMAGEVLQEACNFVRPGVSTKEIDEFAGECIKARGVTSAFLGYRGYPCNICISVNEEIVHGLANDRRLQFGDIVSLDCGVKHGGFIGDTARTIPVGSCSLETQKLIDVTREALYDGISRALPGNRVKDISRAVQNRVEANGFSIVREFVGHGVGRVVHEEPQVPNFVSSGASPKLRAGMTLAIEPMVNAGGAAIRQLRDGWTVVARDGLPSAHQEHTVLVTEGEPEILTCLEPRTARTPSPQKVS
ncbi:MAG: type I methionyl aminopeptidase [Verrucomicrobiales bacterium]|nr:type I methionyl aminopeptidase [Verrucomicrobiales bacterium]|tara:strand:- start:889 stop:1677 length:789 start_codon:yes stop_codon:yes gene_type:complete